MKFHRRRFLHLVGVAAAVAVLSVTVTGHGAWSQTARTIKVVVPVQPGGSNDFLARVLGEEIGRAQGPTMVIENRPGAGSIIGTEAVSHAAPDGNGLLITSPTVVINPHLRKVNYDPLISFEPICYLANAPTVIVVNSASPYRTLADLLDAARAKPSDLTIGSCRIAILS
jgi:tripartite-type tricarboxylate transporter receptor subunit TctC